VAEVKDWMVVRKLAVALGWGPALAPEQVQANRRLRLHRPPGPLI
jgi:hypothetical protein